MRRRPTEPVVHAQATAAQVRRSVRHRLLFANVAGAVAVFTFVQLASGATWPPRSACGCGSPVRSCPPCVLIVPGYLWGHRRSRGRSRGPSRAGRPPWPSGSRCCASRGARRCGRCCSGCIAAFVYGGIAALFGASFVTVARVVTGTVLGGADDLCARLPADRAVVPAAVRARARPACPTGGPARRASGCGCCSPGRSARACRCWPWRSCCCSTATRSRQSALAMLSLAGLAAGFLATVAAARSLAEPLDGAAPRPGPGARRRPRRGPGRRRRRRGRRGAGGVQPHGRRAARAPPDPGPVRPPRRAGGGRRRPSSGAPACGGEDADASVVFVDIVGSTAMAEVLPPDDVVETLNDFFDVVVRAVDGQGGWVNKFEGDGALCVFGVPGTQPDHADRALRAARLLHLGLGDAGRAPPRPRRPASACRRAGWWPATSAPRPATSTR